MSEDLEFLGELIDGFLEEAPELIRELDAGLEAAESAAGAQAAEGLAPVLDTLRQRGAFLEFDAFTDVVDAMQAAVTAVQEGRIPYEEVAGVLRRGRELVGEGLARLEKHDTGPYYPEQVLQELKAAILARHEGQDTGDVAKTDADVAQEEPAPESLVALRAEEAQEAGEAQEGPDSGQLAPAEMVTSAGSTGGQEPEAEDPELEEIEVVEGPIPDEAADFVPDFITEAGEILEKLDEDLVRLEDAPDDLDLLNEIFRAAHTMKGTSAFLGFAQMSDLTHKMESVLDLLRKGEMSLTPEIMDVILEGVDQIKVFMEDIASNQIVRRDVDDLRRRLAVVAATRGGSVGEAVPGDTPGGGEAASGPDAPPGGESAPPAPGTSGAEQPPSPGAGAQASPGSAAEKKKPAASGAKGAATRSPHVQVEQVIRVGVDRIDNIMNLAEELVLGRNRLLQLNDELQQQYGDDDLVGRLGEATSQVGMLTGELQEAVMAMRMLPVSRVFSRFPRMVRDLARELGKQIELVVEDNDTEMDKSVADEIGDPLVHLIRNAVDHGVEAPDVRQAAGKPPKGTVVLSATHEGNHIVIRIRDDGAGMNVEKLKAKAVEKGILTEADAERMTETDAYNLIFAPGFSMAAKVTDVSGRGVGMDVVKTNITRLNGTIEIDSTLGEGTEVVIRLPLTLAIITGLQVSVGSEIFVVPLTSVIEAIKIKLDQIESLRGQMVVLSRDQVLPLVDLRQALEVEGGQPETDARYVVVAGLAERRVGLLVDRLVGQVDVVIKALGEFVGPADGIAGATILGDGRVRLILDVGALMDMDSGEVAESWGADALAAPDAQSREARRSDAG